MHPNNAIEPLLRHSCPRFMLCSFWVAAQSVASMVGATSGLMDGTDGMDGMSGMVDMDGWMVWVGGMDGMDGIEYRISIKMIDPHNCDNDSRRICFAPSMNGMVSLLVERGIPFEFVWALGIYS